MRKWLEVGPPLNILSVHWKKSIRCIPHNFRKPTHVWWRNGVNHCRIIYLIPKHSLQDKCGEIGKQYKSGRFNCMAANLTTTGMSADPPKKPTQRMNLYLHLKMFSLCPKPVTEIQWERLNRCGGGGGGCMPTSDKNSISSNCFEIFNNSSFTFFFSIFED